MQVKEMQMKECRMNGVRIRENDGMYWIESVNVVSGPPVNGVA